jgi:hypothetical protein
MNFRNGALPCSEVIERRTSLAGWWRPVKGRSEQAIGWNEMRSAPAGRSAIIIIAKGVLTAAVLTAFAPGSTKASCSHYVQINSDLAKYELTFTQFDNVVVRNDAAEASTPTDPQRRQPCSGALCSGQSAPPSSPMQIDVPRAGQWAIIVTPTQAAVNDPVLAPGHENDLRPSHRSTSVYHPPRVSSSFYAP